MRQVLTTCNCSLGSAMFFMSSVLRASDRTDVLFFSYEWFLLETHYTCHQWASLTMHQTTNSKGGRDPLLASHPSKKVVLAFQFRCQTFLERSMLMCTENIWNTYFVSIVRKVGNISMSVLVEFTFSHTTVFSVLFDSFNNNKVLPPLPPAAD